MPNMVIKSFKVRKIDIYFLFMRKIISIIAGIFLVINTAHAEEKLSIEKQLVGIVGAGGPVLSGAIFDASKSYAPAFHVGAAVFLLSLLLSITLKRR